MSDVSFVYKAWQHVAILNAKVVIRTKHIGGDHRGVAPAVLLKVGPARHTTIILTSIILVNLSMNLYMLISKYLLWTSIILFA